MDGAALLALAERCEREQPSRELDAQIGHATSVLDFQRIARVHVAPAYTSSLDAAVTLIPKGLLWQAGAWHDNNRARVGLEKTHNATFIKTPALALCAAALRARAAVAAATSPPEGQRPQQLDQGQ